MKKHYRTTAKGRRKVDSGYNAARRWAKDKITRSKIGMVVFCVGAGTVIGLLIACLASL